MRKLIQRLRDWVDLEKITLDHAIQLSQEGFWIELLRCRGGFWYVIGQKLSSHLIPRWARMGATVQASDSLTYEKQAEKGDSLWALPFVLPAVLLFVAIVRLLARLDRADSDTSGYLVVARFREDPS